MRVEAQVAVIGAGPAGTTVASLLARKGLDVVLIEEHSFPRPHVGESLLPGIKPILKKTNALDEIENAGFTRKYGSTFIWGESNEPWSIDFGDNEYAWQVDRASLDAILLENARTNGAQIITDKINFVSIDADKKIEHLRGFNNVISADFYVDASGQAGVISRRVAKRTYDSRLGIFAVYSQFRDVKRLEQPHEGNIFISSITNGWIWHIPLANDTTSLGFVSNNPIIGKKHLTPLEAAKQCPHMSELTKNASSIQQHDKITDWSYTCNRLRGENYVLIGDAAGFVDPILSSGVYLGMQSAYFAASAIEAKLKGNPTPFENYESKFNAIVDPFRQMVEFWYLGKKDKSQWFERARQIVGKNMIAQRAFSYLAGGNQGNELSEDAGFNKNELKTVFDKIRI